MSGGQPSSYPMIIRIFQSVKSWSHEIMSCQISQICCIYRHDLNLGSSDIIVINITQPNKVVWVERAEPVWLGIIMYAFKKKTLKVIHVRLTLSYNSASLAMHVLLSQRMCFSPNACASLSRHVLLSQRMCFFLNARASSSMHVLIIHCISFFYFICFVWLFNGKIFRVSLFLFKILLNSSNEINSTNVKKLFLNNLNHSWIVNKLSTCKVFE